MNSIQTLKISLYLHFGENFCETTSGRSFNYFEQSLGPFIIFSTLNGSTFETYLEVRN